MYQTPTTVDFQSNLDGVLRDARAEAGREVGRVRAEAAARGLGLSGSALLLALDCLGPIYGAAVDRIMHLIHDFVSRSRLTPEQLCQIADLRLETLSAELIAVVEAFSRLFDGRAQQVYGQRRALFRQQKEEALRNIKIGFIGGRSVGTNLDPVASDGRPLILLDDLLEQAQEYHHRGHKEGAGILATAMFEHTLRRVARANEVTEAGVNLDMVIAALVRKNVITPIVAQRCRGAASVRNGALHAQWDKVTLEDVDSVMRLTRELLSDQLPK